jgi:hypothetical protein
MVEQLALGFGGLRGRIRALPLKPAMRDLGALPGGAESFLTGQLLRRVAG